jgi:hypothetical protein
MKRDNDLWPRSERQMTPNYEATLINGLHCVCGRQQDALDIEVFDRLSQLVCPGCGREIFSHPHLSRVMRANRPVYVLQLRALPHVVECAGVAGRAETTEARFRISTLERCGG